MRTFLTLLLGVLCATASYGQGRNTFFVGKWKGWTDPNQKVDFWYISLTPSGSGEWGQGTHANGHEQILDFLRTELIDWRVAGDTLFLHSVPLPTDNKGNTKSMTIRYVILEKGTNYFVASYSDPEIEKMMKDAGEYAKPIDYRFEKKE